MLRVQAFQNNSKNTYSLPFSYLLPWDHKLRKAKSQNIFNKSECSINVESLFFVHVQRSELKIYEELETRLPFSQFAAVSTENTVKQGNQRVKSSTRFSRKYNAKSLQQIVIKGPNRLNEEEEEVQILPIRTQSNRQVVQKVSRTVWFVGLNFNGPS